jgi:hypothetical protein
MSTHGGAGGSTGRAGGPAVGPGTGHSGEQSGLYFGPACVQVRWAANPFRGNRFQEAWTPYAEMALDFGASAWALLRGRDDQLVFQQLAFFEDKVEWERYWFSPEISEARVAIQGLYSLPLLPVWQGIVGFGGRPGSGRRND